MENKIVKKHQLHTSDKALLKAAETGEGLVVVTPDVIEKLGASIDARTADIKARYPKLVADCPEETRLAVTAWVMQHIVEHAQEGGSFRHLIYDRLGFGPEAYMPLYLAGGMDISNEFDLTIPDPEEQSSEG